MLKRTFSGLQHCHVYLQSFASEICEIPRIRTYSSSMLSKVIESKANML